MGPINIEGFDEVSPEYAESFKTVLNESKWACTNGVDPSTLSKQEYVKAFAAGPCNPAVVLPGIAGSKLIVQIDCKKFKEKNPSTFKSCGWSKCSKLLGPKSEYKMWIPNPLAPMSIMIATSGPRKCWTGLFGFDDSQTAEGKLIPKEGITVVVEGTSPKTRSKSSGKCAFNAIMNLSTTGSQTSLTTVFAGFLKLYENAGYVNGLNLQALPYDFRLDYKKNELNTRFGKVIREMYANWGKKIAIYAHSFGNYQVVRNLLKFTQEEKDQMIARYIALGPPFLGAPQTLKMIFGLDNSFSQDLGFVKVGITGEMFKKTVALLQGFYNLMPKDTFNTLKEKDFMKGIKARIEAEHHGHEVITNTVVDLLPQPTESCLPWFTSRDEFCHFGFVDLSDVGQIEGTRITHENLEDLFDKYGVIPNVKALYNAAKDDLFEVLTNPGVQTNVVFSSTVQTISSFDYEENPKLKTEKNNYVAPTSQEFMVGDNQVLTSSALTAALKWAEDFKNGETGAKPVNMVEICSIKNRRESVFEPGTFQVKNSAYMGIDCNCGGSITNPKDGSDCAHTPMVSDPKVLDFMLKSSIDGAGQVPSPTTEAFANLSNEELQKYEDDCLLINNN